MDRPADRRAKRNRRGPIRVAERLERRRERRAGDRRESPRFPLVFRVREIGSPSELCRCRGDLGVGGAFLDLPAQSVMGGVELRVELPGEEREILLWGKVARAKQLARSLGVHVRFFDLGLADELAIARWVDDQLLAS